MKKGILALALPFAYLACASAIIQEAPLYSYKFWMDEVVKGQPARLHFDCWATTSKPVTFIRYTLTLMEFSTTLFTYGPANGEIPFTISKGGAHFTLNKSFPTNGIASYSTWNVDLVLQGRFDQNQSSQIVIRKTMHHGPGEPYYTKENPFVVTADSTFDPGRSSYDFNKAEKLMPLTPIYKFGNLSSNSSQYLRAFQMEISGIRKENNGEEQVRVSDASVTVFGHGKEYAKVADKMDASGSSFGFYLTPVQISGKTKFFLSNSFSLNRSTGALRKGAPKSKKEIATRYLPMPLGTAESSSLYSWHLDFLLNEKDWIRVRSYDVNHQYGLAGSQGTYRVVLGGR